MNEELNKNSSNVKVLTTLVIILIILVLCLGGYLVYNKVMDKDDNNQESDITENNQIEQKDYDLVEAKKLVDKYFIPYNKGNVFEDNYTDENKIILAYLNLSNSKISNVSCTDIYSNNSNALSSDYGYIVNLNLTSFTQGYCEGESTTYITYEDLNSSYKELFGSDKLLSKQDFSHGYDIYDYDEKSNSFVLLSCNCGGRGDVSKVVYGVKTAKISDNKLSISVGYLKFVESESGDKYETVIGGEKIVYDYIKVDESNFENEVLNKYLNKMDTYKFTFVKENNHYILENMVKE